MVRGRLSAKSPGREHLRPFVVGIVMAVIACGPRGASTPAGTARAKPGLEVTLYRDHAVVGHRIEVRVPAAAPATIKLRIAAGVDPADVYLIEKSELVIREARAVGVSNPGAAEGCDEVSCVLDNYERACCSRFERKPSEWEDEPARVVDDKLLAAAPAEIELVVGAPREGTYSLVVGYDTPRLAWDAAYTMTTPPSRDRVQLRGALSVRNATGLAFTDAQLRVVDAQHGAATQRLAQQLEPKPDKDNSSPVAEPRDLGRVTLVEGDSRVVLIDDKTSRPMHSVLIYDPVGPGIDYQHAQPVQDLNLGVKPPPSTIVKDGFAIDRASDTRHLPGGPVRLFERRADGSIVLLAESNLFGTAMLVAGQDTVAVGAAVGVTGNRERRELTIDNERRRVVEEIALTIDNTRDKPVEVVLREHLYRGENWTIAYRSVFDITREGKQQISMRAAVPARSKQTVLYVVVYSWEK